MRIKPIKSYLSLTILVFVLLTANHIAYSQSDFVPLPAGFGTNHVQTAENFSSGVLNISLLIESHLVPVSISYSTGGIRQAQNGGLVETGTESTLIRLRGVERSSEMLRSQYFNDTYNSFTVLEYDAEAKLKSFHDHEFLRGVGIVSIQANQYYNESGLERLVNIKEELLIKVNENFWIETNEPA